MSAILKTETGKDGIERHYILPIESNASFDDLLNFVCSDYNLKIIERIEGPDAIVCKTESINGNLTFVLSDLYGTSLFGLSSKEMQLAERVAKGIEERILEVTNSQ